MAGIKTVVDECLAVATAFTSINSQTYNELGAVNYEDNDKDFPYFLFDKRSITNVVESFTRTNLPKRVSYTQTVYFIDTYTEDEKDTVDLQTKQDALMVIAEQYFAELRQRNESGENGFFLDSITFIPNDEQHSERLVQISYTMDLTVIREACDLGTFVFVGLDKPTGLDCTATETTVDLSWVDNATTETNYEIFRSLDCENFTLINTIAANSTTYQDTGLTGGVAYLYKIRAINAASNGEFSDIIICCTETAGSTPTGIAYDRPGLTGQMVSFQSGDDGFHLLNGTYDITEPVFPISFAKLDTADAEPFLTLLNNNSFGNKSRFTDDVGGQTYANDLVVDNLTGLMYYRILLTADTWTNQITATAASTQGGHSDWRMVNFHEITSISTQTNSLLKVLDYFPFSIARVAGNDILTSTTRGTTSLQIFVHQSVQGGRMLNQVKTTSDKTMIVRNFFT